MGKVFSASAMNGAAALSGPTHRNAIAAFSAQTSRALSEASSKKFLSCEAFQQSRNVLSGQTSKLVHICCG